ncbi:MAG: hypothetical protein PHR84_02435 [Candidatus Omnitrophica bacterium]|jgi:hypothetical protein|nr:hypothetical protein [Candidatus Omnitrophota bacterium]MDD5660536.1 hypothetical protein [Candidatus Omnitrophota bacterium]
MRRRIVLLILAVIFIAGCSMSPAKGKKPFWARDYIEENDTFVHLDGGLEGSLRLVEESTDRTEDSRLIVKAKLMNRYTQTLRVQIQTVFKDKDGFATGDETNWELVPIPAKAYHYYEAKAMNTKSEKYTIRCRYAK